MPNKQITPPLAGATNAGPFVRTPGDANPVEGLQNVRPRRPGTGRVQLAQRPGMTTLFHSGSAYPVQEMGTVGRSTGVSGYVTSAGNTVAEGDSVEAGAMRGQFVVLDQDWSVRAVFWDDRGTGLAASDPPGGHDGNSVCFHPTNADIGFGVTIGRDTTASNQDVVIFGISRFDLSTNTITHQTWGLDTNTSYAAGSYPAMPGTGQVDLYPNEVVCNGTYLFVAVRGYVYVFRSDNLTYIKRHAIDWTMEVQSIRAITVGSTDYLMVLSEGANNVSGPVTNDSGALPHVWFGWFFRSGVLKHRIEYADSAKSPVAGGSTVLTRMRMPMGRDSGDAKYEDHRYFRLSEWSLQRPRGPLVWAMEVEVDSDNNVWAYIARTNSGFGPDTALAPDGSVAYVSACCANLTAAFASTVQTTIDPNTPEDYGFDVTVGGWEIDTDSLRKTFTWHATAYQNDIPNASYSGGRHDPHYPGEGPSLMAVALDAERGRVFFGGRRPSPSQALPNVYAIRTLDGVRLWDTDLRGQVQQNGMAVDPTSGNLVVGIARTSGWEGDPASQKIHLAELDVETGEVVRWVDFGDGVLLNSYCDEVSVYPVVYDVAVNSRGQVAFAMGPCIYDT